MKLDGNHITFTSSADISRICAPLSDIGITSFNFIRIYNDRSRVDLCNKPEWIAHSYEKEYFKSGEFEKNPSSYSAGAFLWSSLAQQEIFNDGRENFGIANGFTLVEPDLNGCDFYYFGSTRDNPAINNFYTSNMDMFKRFVLYFQEKAASIIKEANKNRIVVPSNKIHPENSMLFEEFQEMRDVFVQKTPINKVKISYNNKEIFTSGRELECIISMLYGNTAKMTAKKLGISHRTVESYFERIKNKIGCSSKLELLSILLSSKLAVILA